MPTSATLLSRYLEQTPTPKSEVAAVYAILDTLLRSAPTQVATSIVKELRDQRQNLKLIASENYSSLPVQLAQANWLTDKYAEGFPGHRFYSGCDNVDVIEREAANLACKLFGAEHAYVQPHSGADANLVAFLAVLSARVESPVLEELGEPDPAKLSRENFDWLRLKLSRQRLLAMDYYSGGHLTHGYRRNISSRLFDVYSYSVDQESGLLDLDQLRRQAKEAKPLILLAGYSAYPRKINFAKLREIADEVDATLMVDMAHFAGLVAGGVFTGDYNPIPFAQIVTSTTHKTLRGPRGGLILCQKELAEWVDKGCPMVLGGPLPQMIAAKAVAFAEAAAPEFQLYAKQIVKNAQALAAAVQEKGLTVLTGGTDNHLLLLDVAKDFGLTGRQAESALRECGLTLNRNALPFDQNGPWYTSGLRLGTAAATSLGMGEKEMGEIANLIWRVLSQTRASASENSSEVSSKSRYQIDAGIKREVSQQVQDLLEKYPVYPELDLSMLLSALPQPEDTTIE